MSEPEELTDRPAGIDLSEPELLARGYFAFERFRFVARDASGVSKPRSHDILRAPAAAAVLPVDLARDEVVLIRQFRPAAQLANGRGELVEIVAGRIEPGETIEATARRECREEIGLEPTILIELFTFLTSPGVTDEEITLFVGAVDASKLTKRGGTTHEGEDTRPFRIPIDMALAVLPKGTMRNGPLIVALQWLALNRRRLPEIIKSA